MATRLSQRKTPVVGRCPARDIPGSHHEIRTFIELGQHGGNGLRQVAEVCVHTNEHRPGAKQTIQHGWLRPAVACAPRSPPTARPWATISLEPSRLSSSMMNRSISGREFLEPSQPGRSDEDSPLRGRWGTIVMRGLRNGQAFSVPGWFPEMAAAPWLGGLKRETPLMKMDLPSHGSQRRRQFGLGDASDARRIGTA